jgi:prolyl oligopeptidase
MKATIAMCALLTATAIQAQSRQPLSYPTAAKVDTVDTYFGEKVADPYRWLENDTSKATAKWVEEENAISRAYLEKIPFREALKKRLTDFANYESMGAPFKKHGNYYFFKNNGLQNQSVLYTQKTLKSTPEVLLDPNTLSTDGTVALQNINFSKDGKYMAYVISRSGSDWNEIYVIDLATKKLLDDHIVWAKFTGAEWLGDGFFYSAYDAPKDNKSALSAANQYQKVYYHKIGTPQSSDKLEYKNDNFPLRFYSAEVSDDERFVFINESEGEGNTIYIKDMKAKNPQYTCMISGMKYINSILDNVGDKIYVYTNNEAPNYKVVAYNVSDLTAKPVDVIPQNKSVLSGVYLADNKFIVIYDLDVSSHAFVYSLDGKELNEVKLPTLGSVGFSCDRKQKEVFYTFTSFTYPSTIFSYDMNTNTSKKFYAPKLNFNPEEYTTEQVTYNSKDGTPVKMFLIYKKGLKKDGKIPTYLYGYGGFNISITPGFSAMRVPFVEQGGLYAIANIRGGGEYGETWHQAGTKLHKQNVFDDFIAAAKYLIKDGYTCPAKLAVNGGSNGGLLIGAVVNQRPDLFAAAVPQVGVMDMLRYHKFTIGWNWASDYGRSDDSKEMFKYLRAYSPLHNIKNDGTHYPAILVTTADHDDRVVPAHSFKYTATLQASNTGDAPKIIRIDSKAGHGGGKPIMKRIEEMADIYSFIMYNLGMTMK